MGKWAIWVAMLVAVVVSAPLAAQSMDETMLQAVTDYSAWMDALAEFTKGVVFDEQDLTSFIEHYREMQSLDLMKADEESTDPEEFANNMHRVLAEPEYRSWAKRNGLDPEDWLRTATRISSVLMIVTTENNREAVEAQRQRYEAMVDQQCEHVDAETCRSMREAMAANKAMSDAIADAQTKLPPPTASERALIESRADELTSLMMGDEESGSEEVVREEPDSSLDDGE